LKALLISDIHSNIYALEAIWAQENDADVVYCTGDLVDYGPFPREALDWVRAHDVRCTQGNHDAWVVKNFREGKRASTVPLHERAWVHQNTERLDETDIRFLEQLPVSREFELDGVRYAMTHLYTDYEEIRSIHAFDEFCRERFGIDNGDCSSESPPHLIFGHTHRQSIRILSDAHRWLNPGSISYRRRDDPDQTAHYLTLTDGRAALKRLAYDFTPVYKAMLAMEVKESEAEQARWYFGSR
jgi:predicted phosphodiesterase